MSSSTVVPPSNFVCPLTCEVMTSPVMTKYGHCFEKSALTQWLNRGNDTCPLTRQPLAPSDIISHRSLEQQILGWKKLNGLYNEEEQVDNSLTMFMSTGGDVLSENVERKMAKQALALRMLEQMQLEQEAKKESKSASASSSSRKQKKSMFTKLIRRR